LLELLHDAEGVLELAALEVGQRVGAAGSCRRLGPGDLAGLVADAQCREELQRVAQVVSALRADLAAVAGRFQPVVGVDGG
jgi:hypothetical protein